MYRSVRGILKIGSVDLEDVLGDVKTDNVDPHGMAPVGPAHCIAHR